MLQQLGKILQQRRIVLKDQASDIEGIPLDSPVDMVSPKIGKFIDDGNSATPEIVQYRG